MSSIRRILLVALVALAGGCEVFENQEPDSLSFRMTGAPGDVVTIVYSKEFISATNEAGVTQLEMFRSDTVVHTLPIDTIIDVRTERQMFLIAEPFAVSDTVEVSVDIEVNDRSLFDSSGKLYPGNPWYFLYRFNAAPTQTVEVVL